MRSYLFPTLLLVLFATGAKPQAAGAAPPESINLRRTVTVEVVQKV